MKKIWTLLLSVVFFFVFIALVTIFQKDLNLASAMAALGTLVVALVAALAILNTNEQARRHRKEDLLKEILEWAIDIHKSSLEVNIPFIDMTRIRELEMQGMPNVMIDQMKEGVKKQIETYVAWQKLTSHGKAAAVNEYIKAIAKRSFEKELLKEINSLGNVLIEFLFLEQRLDMGMDYENAKSGFEGEYLEVVEKVEQQIIKSKDKDELYSRYAKDLATSVNELFKKIAEAISNL